MKTFTVNEILTSGACQAYPEDRITSLFGGEESLTMLEILNINFPAADRVSFAGRSGRLDTETKAAWLDKIVTRAITDNALQCRVPAVEAWAVNWLSGTDRSPEAAELASVAANRMGTVGAASAVRAAIALIADDPVAVSTAAINAARASAAAQAWAKPVSEASVSDSVAAVVAMATDKAAEQAKAAEYELQLDDLRTLL